MLHYRPLVHFLYFRKVCIYLDMSSSESKCCSSHNRVLFSCHSVLHSIYCFCSFCSSLFFLSFFSLFFHSQPKNFFNTEKISISGCKVSMFQGFILNIVICLVLCKLPIIGGLHNPPKTTSIIFKLSSFQSFK